MAAWNYWHAYHYLVSEMMHRGLVPEQAEVKAQFPELPEADIREAYAEFDLQMGNRREPHGHQDHEQDRSARFAGDGPQR